MYRYPSSQKSHLRKEIQDEVVFKDDEQYNSIIADEFAICTYKKYMEYKDLLEGNDVEFKRKWLYTIVATECTGKPNVQNIK